MLNNRGGEYASLMGFEKVLAGQGRDEDIRRSER